MGEVILGLPGPWADDNLEASDHYTTKIGGIPDWPFPKSSIGHDLLLCSSCRNNLCLIAQVYAPITCAAVKIEDRVIYVFGCTNSHCASWRAIRVQKPYNVEESEVRALGANHSIVSSASECALTSDTKWLDELYSFECGTEDNGANEDMDMSDLARALSEAAEVASGSKEVMGKHNQSNGKALPLVPKTKELQLVPKPGEVDDSIFVLPCFYIYFQEDKFCHNMARALSTYDSLSVKDTHINSDKDDLSPEEAWEGEGYEYDKALNADRTYLKFKKRLDECPQQCFRYSFGGKPVLATGDVGDAGLCGLCGESRHYEMQLMPTLVYFLEEGAIGAQRDLLNNWSWMTLMVYTCSNSCFQKLDQEMTSRNGWTLVEETVIAQFE